jgi:hypothetical protein
LDEGGTDMPGHKGPWPGLRPVRCGTVPEGSRDAPCAGLAPPRSVLPARIPLKRIAPGSGLGDLGVDGGGGVADGLRPLLP